ncbi:LOW QUALITY PROTEIN: hypothetical protein PanWU01x14_279280 [Parasponia andersonii]|uniref:Uncharacterized protein n=1 Tax=Parasponia andersonii TaxID=3476 RepID=A0A2P5B1V8_PARAD|nr:LOW QUALITY PROTEIN: hypothetical protein PanWU01x14_279280 [Parasponia andersonii]
MYNINQITREKIGDKITHLNLKILTNNPQHNYIDLQCINN